MRLQEIYDISLKVNKKEIETVKEAKLLGKSKTNKIKTMLQN